MIESSPWRTCLILTSKSTFFRALGQVSRRGLHVNDGKSSAHAHWLESMVIYLDSGSVILYDPNDNSTSTLVESSEMVSGAPWSCAAPTYSYNHVLSLL